MSEKRSFVRYDVEGNANLNIIDVVAAGFIIEVSNISFAGLGIYSQGKMELENKLVQFELISQLQHETLSGIGRIKYIIKEDREDSLPVFRMGLEFVNIDKSVLLSLVNKFQENHCFKVKRAQRVINKGNGCTGLFKSRQSTILP